MISLTGAHKKVIKATVALLVADIQQRSGLLVRDPFYDDICELVTVFSHINWHLVHLSLRWGTVGNENWDTDCPGYESPGGTLFLSAHCLPGAQASTTLCVSVAAAGFSERSSSFSLNRSFSIFSSLSRNGPTTLSGHRAIFPRLLAKTSHWPATCLNGPDPLYFWWKSVIIMSAVLGRLLAATVRINEPNHSLNDN